MNYFKILNTILLSRFIHSNRNHILNRSIKKFKYLLFWWKKEIFVGYFRFTNMAEQNDSSSNTITVDGSYLEGVSSTLIL